MVTAREELLAEQVNTRLAKMRRADRWWWLADWRDWVQGVLTGFLPAAFPLGLYFWLSPSVKIDASWIMVALVVAGFFFAMSISAAAAHRRSREQQETIGRLEERIRILEENRDR